MTVELDLMKNHIYQKRKPVDEYIGLLKKHGYGVVDVSEHKFDYRFVDGTTMLNDFLIKLAFVESWKTIIPEPLRAEIFSGTEKRLNEYSNNDSFLTLTIPFVIINSRRN